MATDDFAIPDDLIPEARRIAEAIAETIRKHAGPDASGGGCRLFFSPVEWAARGEEYGKESLLVCVHDGGDAAPFFNYDYCQYRQIERMDAALRRFDAWAGPCTSWYTAIYAR